MQTISGTYAFDSSFDIKLHEKTPESGKFKIKVDDDDSVAIAHFKNWKLEGPYTLKSAGGALLLKVENYIKGKRNGKWFELLTGNWTIQGTWKKDKLHGDDIVFTYPDGIYVKGEAKNGNFTSGAYFKPNGTKIKDLKIDLVNRRMVHKFKKDSDPYEQKHVVVKKVDGMGEGLFAKKSIPKGNLISLYAGVLVPHYAVDGRRWYFNSNTIEADGYFSIDVPFPDSSLSNYTASLGHKANHSFEPNSIYTSWFHPKFGEIMCIEAIKNIKKGREVLVNYGYPKNSIGPKWYQEAKKKHKEKIKQREQRKRKTETLELSYKRFKADE
jgi:[histone H3]-lysine4 N-methyltransferase